MKGDSVHALQKQEGEPVMKSVNGMPYVPLYAKYAFGAIHYGLHRYCLPSHRHKLMVFESQTS